MPSLTDSPLGKESAFRIIPLRPSDYDLVGMFWQGKYYYDRVMPFGCASSCRTFEMFSTAIEWVAKKHLQIPHLIHILGDYLMASPTYHQCRIDLVRFLSLCKYLGIPIAPGRGKTRKRNGTDRRNRNGGTGKAETE